MRWQYVFVFLAVAQLSFAQDAFKGKLVEDNGQPIFAANVFCQQDVTIGTTTDFDGQFEFDLSVCDTLCFSFLGFEQRCISLEQLKAMNGVVVLSSAANTFDAIVVKASDPISNKFSVVKLEKMDIYQNPVAAGDPLRAITLLPSSTNSDESANPVLRGSSSDRSRVTVNSVPIRSPVRNGQLNGVGNFSLFNAEIISKLYVYASNPPLTYGNTTAGLVEVETVKEIDNNQLQISTSLANVGAFYSQRFGERNFYQVYTNYQFADAFLKVNEKNVPNLKDFGSVDAGLNLKVNTGKKSYWNSFNYFIDESFDFTTQLYAFEGSSTAGKTRGFSINNWNLKLDKSFLRLNSLIDLSEQYFNFGNLSSQLQNYQFFSSLDYKLFINDEMTFQTGASLINVQYKFDNQFSEYFFSLDPSTPTIDQDSTLTDAQMEAYGYYNWEMNKQWNLSAGLRTNIPIQGEKNYLSSQLSLRYQPNEENRFLLSGGRYYNYSTPNFSNQNINLLNSYQAALDYSYRSDDFEVLGAVFYKLESGEFIDENLVAFNEVESFGLEFFISQRFAKYFKITLSNTFIDQKISNENGTVNSPADFDYFLKTSLQFNHPKIVNAAISYIGRPGRYYTPIVDRIFVPEIQQFQPVFDDPQNRGQFSSYNNLSLSLTRYFPLGSKAIITFLSLNNLLNSENQQSPQYNGDFSELTFDLYQLRTLYFGAVFQFNNL